MYLFLIILNVKCQKLFTVFNLTAVQICNVNCYQLMQQHSCNYPKVFKLECIPIVIEWIKEFYSQKSTYSVASCTLSVQFQLDICREHI